MFLFQVEKQFMSLYLSLLYNFCMFQNRVPEFPAIGEIEEMWRSGHLGDEDWDADIEALERELEARNAEEKPMDISDDEGLGGEECGHPAVNGDSGESFPVDVNNNIESVPEKEAGACSINQGINVVEEGVISDPLEDIEIDNEICAIMEGKDNAWGAAGDESPITMFKALNLSDEEKEAMSLSDDAANLNKIEEAMAYCDAVLKVLHPAVPPNDLEVSVWEAEFKDEEEVELVTEL